VVEGWGAGVQLPALSGVRMLSAMSYRGVVAWCAASSLAIAAVMACGDTTNVPDIIVVGGDGGGEDARLTSPPDGGADARDAAPVEDASYVGPGCANDTSKISASCQLTERCATGDCSAADSFHYTCDDTDGGTRPDVEGCNPLKPKSGVAQWCCPAACVLSTKDAFGLCTRFYYCPSLPDGGHLGTLPNTALPCTLNGRNDSVSTYCCE
jgi:hypothetical protein